MIDEVAHQKAATVALLRRLADEIERGDLTLIGAEQRVDTGYYASFRTGTRHYFRKNPLTISLQLHVPALVQEERQADVESRI